MERIRVLDNKRQTTLTIPIVSNNLVSRRTLSSALNGISGLYYEDATGSINVVHLDENDNFVHQWDPQIIYKPLFPDSRRSSGSSISFKTKCWNGLTAAAVIVIIWIGSVIPSLWANIYEEIFKKISIYIPVVTSTSSSSEPAMLLSIRITLLIAFSITYLLLAVIIAPTAIRKCWSNFKSWLLGIDAENLGYNALF